MTYSEILTYLYEQLPMFQRQGPIAFKKDLGNIKKLCAAIGNPDQGQRFIHIAGTNGKGSTAHILSSLLQAQGHSVGVYTSPHYKDFRERIKINSTLIPKRSVNSFVNKYRSLLDDIQPSFFEITVALAFWHFKRKKVDFAIIETGLGGRLDSTNVITPLLSVITNIGLDHQNMLGYTLPVIASEKAGIIKSQVPVLIGEYQRKVVRVFRVKAKKEKAPLYFSNELIQLKGTPIKKGGHRLEISTVTEAKSIKATTDINGNYQLRNLQTALAAFYLLHRGGHVKWLISSIKHGLAAVITTSYFLGRWMRLADQPLTIADSAHNLDGLTLVLQQLQQIAFRKLHFIFGTVSDKDLTAVLQLLPKEAIYYFAKANIPRGLNAQALTDTAANFGLEGQAYPSVKKALTAAQNAADKKDLIYIGGSIFVVAEVV